MGLEKYYARWADPARPKILPKEKLPDDGVKQCIKVLSKYNWSWSTTEKKEYKLF